MKAHDLASYLVCCPDEEVLVGGEPVDIIGIEEIETSEGMSVSVVFGGYLFDDESMVFKPNYYSDSYNERVDLVPNKLQSSALRAKILTLVGNMANKKKKLTRIIESTKEQLRGCGE